MLGMAGRPTPSPRGGSAPPPWVRPGGRGGAGDAGLWRYRHPFRADLGAITFTVIDEVLIEFGQLRVLVYGILIIVLFLWIPRGLIPTLGDLLRPKEALPEGRE